MTLFPFGFISLIIHLPVQQGICVCHPYPNSMIYPQYFLWSFCNLKAREGQGHVLIRTPSQNLWLHWVWKDLKARSPSVTTTEVLGSNCQSDPPDTVGFNLILRLLGPLGACEAGDTPDTASSFHGEVQQRLKSFFPPPLQASGHWTAPPGQVPQ